MGQTSMQMPQWMQDELRLSKASWFLAKAITSTPLGKRAGFLRGTPSSTNRSIHPGVTAETRVEVRLKKVTLEAAVSYLHAIESSDQLLTVKSLKMKNRTARSNLLDVTFNVSTFENL